MRTKNAIMNYLTELIPQIIILVLGFFKVKVFLTCLGEELVGLFQLFNQLLFYLSLLDGGAGTIIGYYLYKPISEKNNKSIGSILSGTIKFFTIIASAILVLGLILDFNIMFFIKGSTVEPIVIKGMFIILLVANMLSYFYTPYTLFMDAKQERYKYNVVIQPIFIIRSILEIVLVLIFKNLFVVLIMQLVITIIQNIVVRIIFKKNYNDINLKEKPDFNFLKKVKTIIPHKIGTIVANNIDIVIVSKFISITRVVTYTSYLYIIEVLQKFVDLIAGSVIPGIGNVLVTDEKKAYSLFNEYNYFLYYIATVLCVPLFMSISIFVRIYYGENIVASDTVALMFIILLFYRIIRNAYSTFINAAGLFKETIICVFLEASINLSLSLILVKRIEMVGLLLGTIIACLLSEYVIKPNILNKKVFKQKKFKYYLESILFTGIFAILLVIFKFSFSNFYISNLLQWFIYSLVIFIINLVLVTFVYKIMNKCVFFDRVFNLLKEKMFHGKS